MISAIEWVPAGVADPNPKKYELSAAELELIELMEQQNFDEQGHDNDDDDAGPGSSSKTKQNKQQQKSTKVQLPRLENNLPADLRMDEYSSDDEDDDDDENDAIRGTTIGNLLVEGGDDDMEDDEDDDNDEDDKEDGNANKDTHDDRYGDDDDDDTDDDLEDVPDTREYSPLDVDGFNALGLSHVGTNAPAYMGNDDDDDDDDSDAEDVQIKADDAILVVAKTEEDFASLEVHIYEQTTGNLFVHHDIPLPAFPLCLAHGDISPSGTAGNFCAVGTFTPGVEIWNLDVLNALEPSCILGGEDTSMADEIMRHNMMSSQSKKNKNQSKFKAGKGPSLRPGSHTDAVMSLSWNKVHRQVIASGSADCTVKLWDVTKANNNNIGNESCNAATFRHHKDKVQAVLWHPQEGTLLATGSYDRTVALLDARSQDNIKQVKIPSDCEALAWDPFHSQYLTTACEDGTVLCWDVRKFADKTPLWSMVASEYGGVSDLSYNPNVPGMLATCSVDKTVTLWDTYQAAETFSTIVSEPPKLCGKKDMGVGKLYTVNFYPSSPWLMGCAGGAKELALWDMTREEAIQKRFGSRLQEDSKEVEESGIKENTLMSPEDQKQAFDDMMKNDPAPKPSVNEISSIQENTFNKKTKKGGTKKKNKKAHKVR